MTPKQEQIDAAIAAYNIKREGDTLDDRMSRAITAAAGAGDGRDEWQRQALEQMKNYKPELDPYTIECCAQVADNMAYVESCADDTMRGITNGDIYRKVAAAIRALT